MEYQLFWPSRSLRPIVQFYGILRGTQDRIRPYADLVPPYLGKGLIFSLQERPNAHIRNHFLDQSVPMGYFMPQCTHSFQLQIQNSAQLLAVIFRPGIFRKLFPIPAHEVLDDQMVTFAEAQIPALCILQEQLCQPGTLGSKIQLVEYLLKSQLYSAKVQPGMTDQVLHLIGQRRVNSLQEMSRHLQVSTRHLRQQFTDDMGIPPKKFLRIRRFNWAFQAMQSGQFKRLTDLAYQFQYYDQAHFTQEFKEFMGISPKKFLKSTELVQHQLHWRD